MINFLKHLRKINKLRYIEWCNGNSKDALYLSNEFGGKAGEVLNVVKKLVREERGQRGSKSTIENLADEIADCIICLDSLSEFYNIDIKEAVIKKFNKTSEDNGFSHRL